MIIMPFSFSQAMACKSRGRNFEYYIWFLFSSISLSLIACFRGETGTDSRMYINRYNSQVFMNGYRTFETGFTFLLKSIYSLGFPYQAFFFIVSFIQTLFIFKGIEHEQKIINVKVSIFIYISSFYLSSFNGLRQCLAVSICLYAILLYLDRKWLKSIIFVVIAAQFHRTAYIVLVIIVAYFVYKKSSKFFTYASFALLLLCVFNRQILNEIYKLFVGEYTGYLSNNVVTEGSWIFYLIKQSPIFITATMSFDNYKFNRKYFIIFGLAISGFILGMLEYFTNTQVGRIGDYFSYLDIFLMGYISKYNIDWKSIGRLKIKSSTITILMYAYFYLLFLYNYAFKNFSELFPYKGFT